MKHIPHPSSEVRRIHLWRFLGEMRQEKNLWAIIEAVEEIQKFSHNTEALRNEGAAYLLRFNHMAFERVEALELSEAGKQQFHALIQDYRHNMELQLKYMTPHNQVLSTVSRYQRWILSWLQKMRYQKDSD